MTIWQKLALYLVTFLSGASIMVFELVAPRLFAPYFGTSTYIWTIVIGVVMTSLSLGYYLGGKLADAKPSASTLSALFFVAGLIALFVYLTKDIVLHSSYLRHPDIIRGALAVSLLLLSPVNLVLGMVTPLSVALLTRSPRQAGSSAGNVYALSTLGSIFGTFAAGFWLIPSFGLSHILFGLSLALLLSAYLTTPTARQKLLLAALIIFSSLFYASHHPTEFFRSYYEQHFRVKVVADRHTPYNRVWIYDHTDRNGDTERVLSEIQSSMLLNHSITYTMREQTSYYSAFNLAPHYQGEFASALMIGGGAYTYASYLAENYPDLSLDVVELDGALLALAKEYFEFSDSPNFHNFVQDGRTYLNHNQKRYDTIFLDAYRHGSATPFQLITQESLEKMYNSLNPGGLLFLNVISPLEGPGSQLFASQLATATAVFDHLKVFPIFDSDPTIRQNIVLMATKGDTPALTSFATLSSTEQEVYALRLDSSSVQKYALSGTLLTDDYAPVEYYDLAGTL